MLLELVVTPPPEGDSLAYLAERLPVPGPAIEPAIAALERAGLAIRDGDFTRERAGTLLRAPLAGQAMTDDRHAVLELLLDHHPGLLSIDESSAR